MPGYRKDHDEHAASITKCEKCYHSLDCPIIDPSKCNNYADSVNSLNPQVLLGYAIGKKSAWRNDKSKKPR